MTPAARAHITTRHSHLTPLTEHQDIKTRHALTVSVAKPRRLDDDEDGPHVNHSSTPDASGERHAIGGHRRFGAREEVPPCCVTVISAYACCPVAASARLSGKLQIAVAGAGELAGGDARTASPTHSCRRRAAARHGATQAAAPRSANLIARLRGRVFLFCFPSGRGKKPVLAVARSVALSKVASALKMVSGSFVTPMGMGAPPQGPSTYTP